MKKIEQNSFEYPKRLNKLTDPPAILNVIGKIPDIPMVALIGTRKSDIRMKRFTHELAGDLVRRGYGILSGGALGIDTAAHMGALDNGGVTVAIIGSGFNYMYPASNRELFSKISQNGAVISEFQEETPPSKWTFPRRNRLVAAMASAVVVVQAPLKSGAMITARLASSLGVPLGAVPASPGDEGGSGCNLLIKSGVAIIENINDVLSLIDKDSFMEQLDLSVPNSSFKNNTIKKRSVTPKGMSEIEAKIWDILSLTPLHIDEIISRTQLTANVAGSTLLNMELSGFIEQTGGKRYVRN
jgi:DNA processing protein